MSANFLSEKALLTLLPLSLSSTWPALRNGLQAAVSCVSRCRVLYPHSVVSIHLQGLTNHLAVRAHERRADLHEPLQHGQATT